MRFLPKGLNPFKIQIRFKLEFASKFYNSKCREILKLEQKGKNFHLSLSINFPNLEIFRVLKVPVFYFASLGLLNIWKIFRI
jgi:hypothetical protein